MKALWALSSLLIFLFSTLAMAKPNREFNVDKTNGQAPLLVTFDASNIKPAKKYFWTFGNGETLTTTNSFVSYLYNKPGTFTASLKYAVNASNKDLNNLKDAGSVVITATKVVTSLPPVASLNCQTNNLLVSCNALSSFSPSGLPLSFSFDYGDGFNEFNSTGFSSHAYTQAGLYPVKLIVSDSSGAQSTSIVQVQPVLPPNVPPVLKLSCSSPKPLTIECDSLGSADSDGSIVSCQYLFDDNSYVSKADNNKVIHTFSSGGSHLVKLSAVDNDGGQASIEQSFEVKANTLPVASFSCVSEKPYQVSCQASAADADMPNDSITDYSWSLNNESISGQTLAYIFKKGGEFAITLSVKDSYGGIGTITQNIAVKDNIAPVAEFTCTNTGIMGLHCESKATDADGTIASTKWSLDDGTNLETASIDHTFSTGADHNIKLTVTDDLGISTSNSQSVHLIQNQLPTFDFVSDVITGTLPLNVRFQILNAADVDGSIASTQINFGDNTSSNLSDVTHTYSTEGTYNAKAIVTDNLGGVTTNNISIVVKAPVIINPPTAFFKYFQKGTYLELRAFLTKTQYDIARAYYTVDNSKTIEMSEFYQNTLNTIDVKTYGPHTIKLTVVDTTGQIGTYTHNFNLQDNPDLIQPFVGFRAVQSAPRTVFINMNQTFTPIYEEDVVNYHVEFGNGHVEDISNDTFATYSYPAAGTYTIKVTATTSHHTSASFSRTVSVNNNTVPVVLPNASFSYRIYDFAQNVTFYNERSGSPNGGIISYLWDFGDGSTGTGELAAHFYEPGSYFVKLTVTDFAGYTSTQVQHISVYGAGDSIAATMGCSQDFLKVDCWFVALDKQNQINYTNVNWGDGTSSTPEMVVPEFGQYQVSHEYKVGGTFNVEGFVGTERGESKITYIPLNIVPPAPIANIECFTNNLLVSCNALGSYDPFGGSLSYTFDFSDGFVESNLTGISSHAYKNAGVYLVKVKVASSTGFNSIAESQVMAVVPVNIVPSVYFNCISDLPNSLKCIANGSQDRDGMIVSYIYEWDDNTKDEVSSVENVTHRFTSGGVHQVKVTALDNDGGENSLTKTFEVMENHAPYIDLMCYSLYPQVIHCDSYATDSDMDDHVVEYKWDLGNGIILSSLIPSLDYTYSKAGTYTIKAEVKDSFGATSSVQKEVAIKENLPPVANISCNAINPLSLTCYNLSYDPEQMMMSTEWFIDDQPIDVVANNFFTLNLSEGVRKITLKVTDAYGAVSVKEESFTIKENIAPIANLLCVPVAGFTYRCDSNAWDSDGSITESEWTVEGKKISGTTLLYDFTNGGSYTITFTAKDNLGKSATFSTEVIINKPIIAAICSKVSPFVVKCDASGSRDPGGKEIISLKIYFDDEEMLYGPVAEYEFENSGDKTVKIELTNSLNQISVQEIKVNVPTEYVLPKPIFYSQVEHSGKVFFDASESLAQSRSVVRFDWDFGEGQTDSTTEPNIQHTFDPGKYYDVTLKVVDQKGQEATVKEHIYIFDPIVDDPGEAGLVNLLGIDSDQDGIRDDVQRWIQMESKENDEKRRYIRALAGIYEQNLRSLDNLSTIAGNLEKKYKISMCLQKIDTAENGDQVLRILDAAYVNTNERAKANLKIEENFAGNIINLEISDTELIEFCQGVGK